jgi:AraC-like DNA-binding protein
LQVDPAPPPARGVDARERVRERLGRHPSAKLPELCQMASQLHVSPRTLKRHLQQQGTSYRRLLDERRALICGGLLRQPGLTLESIAEALGYSTAANFSRAFQRWAGMTPGARRAQLRQEP